MKTVLSFFYHEYIKKALFACCGAKIHIAVGAYLFYTTWHSFHMSCMLVLISKQCQSMGVTSGSSVTHVTFQTGQICEHSLIHFSLCLLFPEEGNRKRKTWLVFICPCIVNEIFKSVIKKEIVYVYMTTFLILVMSPKQL